MAAPNELPIPIAADADADASVPIPVCPNAVDVDRLLTRLYLEKGLQVAVAKFALLSVYLLCFMGALHAFQPAEDTGEVHRQLENHFGLGAAAGIVDLDDILGFATTFEDRNSALRANSGRYWCEERFFSYKWDNALQVPTRTCDSPRLELLGMGDGTNDGVVGTGPWQNVSIPPADCVDDVVKLRAFTGNQGDSCSVSGLVINSWCQEAITAGFCRRSCGFCGPHTYESMGKYTRSQLAVAPAVLFQSRLEPKACEEFAHTFSTKSLYQYSDQHGIMKGFPVQEVITCPDRSKPLAKQHVRAGEVIPKDSIEFRGDPVFATLLASPEHDIKQLREALWIDGLTQSVTVATIVYSAYSEIFTYLAVEFKVDRAGGVESAVQMKSYKEMKSVANFLGCMITAIIFIFLSAVGSMPRRDGSPVYFEASNYERIVQVFSGIFMLVVVMVWAVRDRPLEDAPYSFGNEYYNVLLEAFVNMEDISDGERDKVIANFFGASTELTDWTVYLFNIRVASYFFLLMMFSQAAVFLSVHPRVGTVARTVRHSLMDIGHLIFMMTVHLLMLGFCAYVSFGGYLVDYRTFSSTMSLQVRGLCGEVLEVPGDADRLHGARLFLYWFYSVVFLFLVFWTLAFVFLAVVVDAFTTAKGHGQHNDAVAASNSFLWDLFDTLHMPLLHTRRFWPLTGEWLSTIEDEDWSGLVSTEDFCKIFEHKSVTTLDFLGYMDWKCGGTILTMPSRKGLPITAWAPLEKQAPSKSSAPASKSAKVEEAAAGSAPPSIPELNEEAQRSLRDGIETYVVRNLAAMPSWSNLPKDQTPVMAASMAYAIVQEVQRILYMVRASSAAQTAQPAASSSDTAASSSDKPPQPDAAAAASSGETTAQTSPENEAHRHSIFPGMVRGSTGLFGEAVGGDDDAASEESWESC